MPLFAARTRYSLVKGERIVRFVLTAWLREFLGLILCCNFILRQSMCLLLVYQCGTQLTLSLCLFFSFNVFNQTLQMVFFNWSIRKKDNSCVCLNCFFYGIIYVFLDSPKMLIHWTRHLFFIELRMECCIFKAKVFISLLKSLG